MAEKRVYRSVLRSKRMIRDAFLHLLDQKNFEQITISDIVKQADLNRSTFYAHYSSIGAVIDEIQTEWIRTSMEMIRSLSCKTILNDPVSCLNVIGKALADFTKLSSQMNCGTNMTGYMEKYKQALVAEISSRQEIPELIRNSPAFKSRLHFIIGGIMTAYQQWAMGKLDCSLEEVSMEIAVLIHPYFLELLDAQPSK